MDSFEKWLNEHPGHYALTDASYRKIYQKNTRTTEPTKLKVNTELATYGDAILKLALCEILYEKSDNGLSEEKKKYEKDEILVKVIAQYYKILENLRYDEFDREMPKDYDYKDAKHKYIATAIEACLGAIWIDNHNFEEICDIVRKWKDLISESSFKV